jgi:hypothetical protein
MRKKEEREMKKKKYSWFNLGMLEYLRDVIHVRLSNILPILTLPQVNRSLTTQWGEPA